jgi:hypothetical protein
MIIGRLNDPLVDPFSPKYPPKPRTKIRIHPTLPINYTPVKMKSYITDYLK